MPIPASELRRDFIVVDELASVRLVRDRVAASGSPWTYVVVSLASGKFVVLRLAALIRALQQRSPSFQPELLELRLRDLPELLAARAADAVERDSVSLSEARARLGQAPGRRLVVLDGSAVAGLLVVETRGLQRPVDLGWLDQPESRPVAANGGGRPRTLSVDDRPRAAAVEPAPMAPPPPAPAAPEPERRWINAELLDHDPAQPLSLGQTYTLSFDVDLEVRAGSLVPDAPFSYRFAPGEELVELTVQLTSDDFSIYTDPQKLFVPRQGKSRNRARFDVEPKHEGQGVITAVFLKDGNFIQLVTLKLQVGGRDRPGLLSTEALGRPLDAATIIQPRDLSLTILNTGSAFQMIVAGSVSCLANLPFTAHHLAEMIDQARQDLLEVVNLQTPDGRLPYQEGLDIPPEVHQEALRLLARSGFRLYQRLFYGPAADAQTNLVGDRLREMARGDALKIQIVSQQLVLPWAMLYLADSFDPDRVDPELFLGLRHTIEHIPLQPSMRVVDPTIGSQPSLTVGLNVNADIDQQMGVSVVADQLGYWGRLSQRAGTRTILRKTDREVTRALADALTPDQILYFYCHAISRGLDDPAGPDSSCLVFSGDRRLTLEDLNLSAPARQPLAGAPLVFINACESAELSPLFYDGFVPYFMSKGARGVIGTECSMPALFAAEWAARFFNRFLAGEPLGQSVLGLRRQFLEQHRNLLGLLYAVYCDGDTRVVPGVPVS